MDWTTQSLAEANHPPVPVLDHPHEFTVRSGEGFGLGARGTTDPDGDSLSYFWFHYREAGSYEGEVTINGAENAVSDCGHRAAVLHRGLEYPLVDGLEAVCLALRGCAACLAFAQLGVESP